MTSSFTFPEQRTTVQDSYLQAIGLVSFLYRLLCSQNLKVAEPMLMTAKHKNMDKEHKDTSSDLVPPEKNPSRLYSLASCVRHGTRRGLSATSSGGAGVVSRVSSRLVVLAPMLRCFQRRASCSHVPRWALVRALHTTS